MVKTTKESKENDQTYVWKTQTSGILVIKFGKSYTDRTSLREKHLIHVLGRIHTPHTRDAYKHRHTHIHTHHMHSQKYTKAHTTYTTCTTTQPTRANTHVYTPYTTKRPRNVPHRETHKHNVYKHRDTHK